MGMLAGPLRACTCSPRPTQTALPPVRKKGTSLPSWAPNWWRDFDARPQFLDQLSKALVDVPANEADVLDMIKDVGHVIVARANPTASASYCRRAAGALLRDALKDAISEVRRHE